jgi:hypothetical protein
LRPFTPALRRAAGVDAFHCDSAGRGADEIAEVAADAFFFDDVRVAKALNRLPVKALVRAVLARDIAKVAADAVFGMHLGDDVVIKI